MDGFSSCEAGEACECTFKDEGRGVCTNSSLDADGNCTEPKAYESTEQSCSDGLDNDCDGQTDCVDPDCTGQSCGLGQGTAKCVGEVCKETNCFDGADNDEDGAADCNDPDCAGRTCKAGTEWTCPQPEDWAQKEADAQLCDGLDNDCDGAVDEGCGCTYDPTEQRNNDTDDSHLNGVCVDRTRNDSGSCGRPSTFESRTGSESSCDQKDDDCDGTTDEGCGCTYDPEEPKNTDTNRSNNFGVCVNQSTDARGVCQKPSTYEAPTEREALCNSKDDDCDGHLDEGCDCTYDPAESDDADSNQSHGAGVCKNQERGSEGICEKPSEFQRFDIASDCGSDGNDNDCDGSTDEAGSLRAVGSTCDRGCECRTNLCKGGTCVHQLFVSSKSDTGDLGGVSGADSKCRQLADGKDLGSGGRAIVWNGGSAKSRISVQAKVYQPHGGRKIADGSGDMWNGRLDLPPNVSEKGTTVPGVVWTGSQTDGSTGTLLNQCINWYSSGSNESAKVGLPSRTNGRWVGGIRQSRCDSSNRIYCINGQ